MVIVVIPLCPGQPINCCKLTKNSNSDKPVITSGITKGEAIIPVNKSLPLNCLILVRAIPANVPIIVANVALTAAIRKLKRAAFKILSLLNSSMYHRMDQPPQIVTSLESLKE